MAELTSIQNVQTNGQPEEARSMYQNIELTLPNGTKSVARVYVGDKAQVHQIKPAQDANVSEMDRLVAGSTDTYLSQTDYISDVRSKRYQSDAAFRNAVVAKAIRSKLV